MADSSPLAGLLDRAAQILNLVGELADGIRANEQSPGDETQRRVASAWKSLLPAIVEAGESLPTDPSPVADWIREVGRVSKWFDGAVRQHGLADVLFRFNCDGFIRVDEEGRALFKEMAAERDPFAFVDEPAAGNPLGIDTTPATPKSPIQFVEAAAREIPGIMADVAPRHDGAIELIASHLAKRLQDAGHTLAAAQWAVHESVRAGRLQPGLIEVELPSFGRVVGGTMRHWGGRDDRRMEWSGGGKGTVGIPKDKPAPFDSFKVIATESLWTWWHSAANESSQQSESAAPVIKAGEASSQGSDLERLIAALEIEIDDRETSIPDELVTPEPLRGSDLYQAVQAVERYYGGKLPMEPWQAWRGMLLRADEGKGEADPNERYYVLCETLCRWARAELSRIEGAYSDCDGLIKQLLAGPDDAELSPRKLALLEAYLKQPVSMAAIQREKQATGESETSVKRNKLKLICDFNRNLRAVTPTANEAELVADKMPEAANGQSASQPVLEAPTKSNGGWMGDVELATALGVQSSQIPAFRAKLKRMRDKGELSIDDWQEFENRKRNEPQFLYRANTPTIVAMAKRYSLPK